VGNWLVVLDSASPAWKRGFEPYFSFNTSVFISWQQISNPLPGSKNTSVKTIYKLPSQFSFDLNE
jgi:hypothetical protein